VSFEAQETHPYAGAPIEFFKFSLGSTVWRYTSSDETVSIADPTTVHSYSPAAISRDQADFSQEDSGENVEVRVPLDNPVAALFVAYTPVAPVALTIYAKHRSDAEIVTAFIGEVLSISFEGAVAKLTCAPVKQALRRVVPSDVYQSRCNHVLFSAACGLDRAAWKDTAALTTVTGVTLSSATFDARADGFYRNGWVERTNGERRFIVEHVGAALTLMNAFPADLIAGETVIAYAGCDRTEAACTAFANLVNHLGFPRIPTRNPFAGGIV
jgi:uncharacterized phage protein (TIGR02218 family)